MTNDRQPAYRVLARKYRPQSFADLIGQDALVRTLSNAIESGRVAQAFMLTGVRGVGKTTTARILARALNCVGQDGAGGPTITPCGACEPCRAIAEDRHIDVIEIDAASNTGVDNIREIIEAVRYQPALARTKVYIIDEVHMLSKSAFNALLKTLEEPPPHTKFIFATTEIRKVPVTVLSRCQRFDLRRVELALLTAHFARVAQAEGAEIEEDAARAIARAADGSVRDGLSLLDQAIALADAGLAAPKVTAELVRGMLGLADRDAIWDLLQAALEGEVKTALEIADRLHAAGAEALVTVQDLLEACHLTTRVQALGDGESGSLGLVERERAAKLAQALSVPVLVRAWQILLKGAQEVQSAGNGRAALDMVLIRLAHVADLPTPGELARALDGRGADGADRMARISGSAEPSAPAPRPVVAAPTRTSQAAAAPAIAARQETAHLADPKTFEDMVALFETQREALLRAEIASHVHLVRFEPGRIEFRPAEGAPRDLAPRIAEKLGRWTGRRWVVAIAASGGAPTLVEQTRDTTARRIDEARDHPIVRAYLDAFPGATVDAVTPIGITAAPASATGEENAGAADTYPSDDIHPLDDGDPA